MFIIFIVMKNIISETNRIKELMNLPTLKESTELDVFPATGGFDIGWDPDLQKKLNKGGGFDNPKHNSDFSTSRTDPRHPNHIGVDIYGKKGSPVVSPVDGVAKLSNNATSGLVVTVEDKDGYCHFMGHLDSVTVEDGKQVFAGDEVGTLGNTGNASITAPHIHYNVYKCSSGFNSGKDPFGDLKNAIGKTKRKEPTEKDIHNLIDNNEDNKFKDVFQKWFDSDDEEGEEPNTVKDLETLKDDENEGVIDYMINKGKDFIQGVIDLFN